MGYLIVFVSIWIIFVMYRLSKEMKKAEEKIKKTYNTTEKHTDILKKQVEEEIRKRNEFEQKMEEEILELLKGYTDNKIEFNLHSLFNYLDENKVVYSIRPYSAEKYGINIILYNYKCHVVCKMIQGFSLVRITELAIIDQKNKGGISYV